MYEVKILIITVLNGLMQPVHYRFPIQLLFNVNCQLCIYKLCNMLLKTICLKFWTKTDMVCQDVEEPLRNGREEDWMKEILHQGDTGTYVKCICFKNFLYISLKMNMILEFFFSLFKNLGNLVEGSFLKKVDQGLLLLKNLVVIEELGVTVVLVMITEMKTDLTILKKYGFRI